MGILTELPLDKLVPTKSQPFNEALTKDKNELLQSICENGLFEPIIVILDEEEKYKILAGHTRVQCFKELKKETIPARIIVADEDVANLIMIDTNVKRRSELSTMEKARALKLRMEIKAKRPSDNSYLELLSEETRNQILEEEKISKTHLYRLIALTRLTSELQTRVDSEKISIKVWEQISSLPQSKQKMLAKAIGDNFKISESQVKAIKDLEYEDKLTPETIQEVLNAEKKENKTITIKFTSEEQERYFGNKNTEEVKQYIIELLDK
jgi:ParB family chromosome partitioning protein